METILFDLIYNQTLKGKMSEAAFIKKLISTYINFCKLNDYVSIIKISYEQNPAHLASYYNNTITIYMEAVKAIYNYHHFYDQYFTPFEKKINRNLILLQSILHEIAHIKQCQLLDSNASSFEKRLMEVSFEARNIKMIDDVTIDPSERLAEIKAYKVLRRIVRCSKSLMPGIYELQRATLFETMLMGYSYDPSDKTCPLQKYLKQIGREDIWNNYRSYKSIMISFSNKNYKPDYLEFRLLYGLPINSNEYNQILDLSQVDEKILTKSRILLTKKM
ncbi:MAG: hypothetical protein PHE54_01880 [Bacilli bacterium]|nr:hypothetical protein [Bacilli bacterium]